MKQIFTLFASLIMSVTAVFGQVSQNFETISDLATLTNGCWQLSGTFLSSNNNVNGVKSLGIYPTTNDVSAKVITPYINLVAGSSISFSYKISNKLSNGAMRHITVRLQDINGVYTPVDVVTMDDKSSTGTLTFSGSSSVTGIRKLVIDITGNGDGNTYIYLDDIAINGSFNYNFPYSCHASADAALPIQLKNFQALVSADKVQLQWTVDQNEDGNFFEIQKSSDGKEYKTIASVTTTSVVGEEEYNFKAVLETAYYRLKVVRKSGAVSFSQMIFVKYQSTIENGLNLFQNPVQGTLKFGFTAASNASYEVNIYNILGSKVFQTTMNVNKGNTMTSIHLNGQVRRGTYVLEVKNATSRSQVKFVKE